MKKAIIVGATALAIGGGSLLAVKLTADQQAAQAQMFVCPDGSTQAAAEACQP